MLLPEHNNTNNDNGPRNQGGISRYYETFSTTTPPVTRGLIYLLVSSWILHIVIHDSHILDCNGVFVVHNNNTEIYRLLTSVLVNPSLLSNLLAAYHLLRGSLISQQQQLQHICLESTVGSALFLYWTLGLFVLGTNLVFVLVQSALLRLFVYPPAAVWTSAGLWNVVLGLLALESTSLTTSTNNNTMLFCGSLPPRAMPLVYWVLLGLIGAPHQAVAMALSMGLGYAIGERWNRQQRHSAVDTVLLLPAHIRTALDRWGSSSSWKGWREPSSNPVDRSGDVGTSSEGVALLPSSHNTASGHTLGGGGGASFRNVDARAARLQALEQRGSNP